MDQPEDARAATAPGWRIRAARPDDVTAIRRLVLELAEYEREPDAVEATAEDFTAALFGPDPLVHAHVAEVEGAEGPAVAGMAVWYVTFSTWRGRHGLWLEDLYVRPEHRRLGLGQALIAELAAICQRRGYARFEWSVLDWNEPAHAFYRSIGAIPQDEWTVWRVDGPRLRALASAGPQTAPQV
jgi:GNAT superfamily N-acetyltransferase